MLFSSVALYVAASDSGLPYRKQAGWHETMLASRAALHTPGDPLEGIFLSAWEVSGPYRGDFATPHAPEKGEQGIAWQVRPEWTDGGVHIWETPDNSAWYLRRTITSTSARTVTASFGAKHGLAVWLNGSQIASVSQKRKEPAPGQNMIALPLGKGGNTILVKVWQKDGGPKGLDVQAFALENFGMHFLLTRPVEIDIKKREAMDQLWARLRADFPDVASQKEMDREERDGIWEERWPEGDEKALAERYAYAVKGKHAAPARALATRVHNAVDIAPVRALYYRARALDEAREALQTVDPEAVRLAVEDLKKSFGKRYPKGDAYLRGLALLEQPFLKARAAADRDDALEPLVPKVLEYQALSREALLANPMLDFDRLLLIRRNVLGARTAMSDRIGMVIGNSWTNDSIRPTGWDNQIVVLSNLRSGGKLAPFYRPDGLKIVSDIDLNFDAARVMFSSVGSGNRWRLFELKADGSGLRQITPDVPDIDHFDSCYLPDGKIAFASTANYQAMPCIDGGAPMAQLYTSDGDGKNMRQITFEQDSDWTPSVLNDGRLSYLRWEYADIPHYFGRRLFASNPDGTGAMEYLSSNSYFPNAFFYARPIPGHPSQVVGIVSGHHGVSRTGRMIIFDPALGRHEADGVVQEIPGRGKKVEPIIKDALVDGVWPQFIHPYPLADYADPDRPAYGGKYFVVAMKRNPDALWGIYLADTFNNLTLIKEVEGAALLEPVPFRPVPRPPVIPDRIKPGEKTATVYLTDVYSGPGLAGIPRGKVKRLRVFAYHFNYNRTGGHHVVGIQSGWDIKRILGTVPVEADGSASFKVPANTPVSVQPLDERGRALQLMRSWFVGMPGEVVSCVGCHDRQNTVPVNRSNSALRRGPVDVKPWYGPPRPVAFRTEVQPVLDRYCVSCHNGAPGRPNLTQDPKSIYFTDDRVYLVLQSVVHRYGPESEAHMLRPMEYHTSTSELFQMLEKGHHGVQLDAEAWDRLTTWADLNAPWRGSWGQWGRIGQVPKFRDFDQVSRRRELSKLYANLDTDPEHEFAEAEAAVAGRKSEPMTPAPARRQNGAVAAPPAGWPYDAAEAVRRQKAAGQATSRSIDLGNGLKLELALIPSGSFVMGAAGGAPDEFPQSVVRIEKPFWIGRFEITNRQYSFFDPHHESRYIDQQGKDHFTPGYPANTPEQPVIRVSWQQAMAFCKWLSNKTGERVTLPTEAQWEWAARAGTGTPAWYGAGGFSAFENLADRRIEGFETNYVVGNDRRPFNFIPYVQEVDDREKITAPVGRYRPNPWGLHDMLGNVAEWTLTTYKEYPYAADGRDEATAPGRKVVRGGSWRDRPLRARSGFRQAYEPYQPVFTVGFRVVMEVR